MIKARTFLPHEPPAVMLQAFETAAADGTEGLVGTVRLADCGLLWMTPQGLPAAFALEILGQLAAVFLRRSDEGAQLAGGRLAAVDQFECAVAFLPADTPLALRLTHLGGSSAGYHKFSGEVRGATRTLLASAQFSVFAFKA